MGAGDFVWRTRSICCDLDGALRASSSLRNRVDWGHDISTTGEAPALVPVCGRGPASGAGGCLCRGPRRERLRVDRCALQFRDWRWAEKGSFALRTHY